ncbi:MAG: hypothetical protein KDD53_12965 [Bdellovibrionales bacterium]|nr:hypothetical protein [Bdellovibrionales bacterium]
MSERKIDRTIQYFDSHEEADEANRSFYRALSPQERLDLALELMAGLYEAHPRFERIYRTADLGECPVCSDWRLGI